MRHPSLCAALLHSKAGGQNY
ncbi:protein of unknown function [Cupriavidus taiwanensis]|nr:protein of unknown function [Cupriavidus taiwanensis]